MRFPFYGLAFSVRLARLPQYLVFFGPPVFPFSRFASFHKSGFFFFLAYVYACFACSFCPGPVFPCFFFFRFLRSSLAVRRLALAPCVHVFSFIFFVFFIVCFLNPFCFFTRPLSSGGLFPGLYFFENPSLLLSIGLRVFFFTERWVLVKWTFPAVSGSCCPQVWVGIFFRLVFFGGDPRP